MPSSYIGLPAIEGKIRAALKTGVNKSALKLEAKGRQNAPVDEGTLRGSFTTTPAEHAGNAITAKVSTGPEADDYAIIQHEENFYHPRGGQSKYLEAAVRSHGPDHKAIMSAALKAGL